MMLEQLDIYMQQKGPEQKTLHILQTLTQKWIIDPNVKCKLLRFFNKNIGEKSR